MTNTKSYESRSRTRFAARSLARELADETGIRGARAVPRGGSWSIKVTSARI